MKGFVKLAPIVVILACAASLFFAFKLKSIKSGLQEDITALTAKLGTAEDQLTIARKDLGETKAELKQSQDETVRVTAQLEGEKTNLAKKTRDADELTDKVAKLEEEVKSVTADKTKAEEAVTKIQVALKAAGLQDVTDIDAVRKKIEALTEEKAVLAEKLKTTQDESARLAAELKTAKTPPEGLRGKVALAKSMWNFIVLDVGAQDKVQPQATFIVYRDSQLVGKAHVTTVYPNSSVAELDPQFTTSPPRAGDVVIHEKL